MLLTKNQIGPVFLLTTALTLVSGLACAQDNSGQTAKQKDAKPLPGVTVTASVPFDGDSHYGSSGLGVISSSGLRHIADLPPTYVYASASTSPSTSNDPSGCHNKAGDPIEINSGTKLETVPVFALPGEMGLKYSLYYNTGAIGSQTGDPGYPSWTSNVDYWLDTTCSTSTADNSRCQQVTAYRPDGSTLTFSGGPTSTLHKEIRANGQDITAPVAVLSRDTATGNYTLQDEDALTEVYTPTGQLLSITDPSGIGWTVTYVTGTNAYTRITHTDGQSFTLAYSAAGETITDPAGNVYTLTPNSSRDGGFTLTYPGMPATAVTYRNTSISNPAQAGSTFTRLAEIDYNGAPYAYTSYVTGNSIYAGWANGTSLADGSEKVSMVYAPDALGNLRATITNPLGHVSTNTYDGTNGSGGAYNDQLSSVGSDAVATCGATQASRAYDANGYLSKTVDDNGKVHTYSYAANGQLQTETEAYGTPQARTTDYVWDTNLQLNRLSSVTVEGWSKTVYTYNAQNRLAAVAVTNLSGNGIANQTLTTSYGYTLYPNGMVKTMTVTHPSPNNSDAETSQYDTLGNLTSLTDGLGHSTAYGNYNGLGEAQTITGPNGDTTSYTYDARGRALTKTTHPNGGIATWSYGYDGFGLLASINAPDGETTTWQRDAVMRVRTVTHNDKDGTSVETYGYDPNGDVTSRTISRNGVTTYTSSAAYDALGRLYQAHGNNGQTLTYSYDGNGNVLAVTDATGHVTGYQYDALDRVIQKSESGGASPPVLSTPASPNVPASNNSGNYTVSWSAVAGATSYALREQVNGGAWNILQSATTATSWNASGKGNGSYGYQVQACNASGCSPWSATATATVAIPVVISINGQNYTSSSTPGSTGGASASIGFAIAGGNTWEVFTGNQHVAMTVVASGAVPAGAATVQYTWTEIGLASGANLGGGTLSNGASTPTALGSNPSSNYSVSMGRNSSNANGLTYQLTVTFYNAAGSNLSTSTCTMTAIVEGTL